MSKHKETPLLSETFRNFLVQFQKENQNSIIEEILSADADITIYNELDENSTLNEFLVDRINKTITDYCRAVTFREKEFALSFTPKGKELIYSSENVWSRKNRQTGKPIRIIQQLVKKKFSNKEYEILNNVLKARLLEEQNFEIVCGEDITEWYHRDNIVQTGSIANSCMIHDKCQSFFSIYEDRAKMLVLFNLDKSLIRGRAILWEIDGQTYMDRVYVCDDYLENNFINYAKERGFCYREHNSLMSTGDTIHWYVPDDDYSKPEYRDLEIENVYNYQEWPYMDTFRYYCPTTKCLTCYPPTTPHVELDHTDGHCSWNTEMECYNCGDVHDEEDMCYCERLDRYFCERCATYSEYEQDWIPCNALVTINYNTNREDFTWVDHLPVVGYENDEFVKINNQWYTKDCDFIYFDEETKKWMINE